MNLYKEYIYMLGQAIIHLQSIERDIKYMIAGMKKGNMKDDFKEVDATIKGLGIAVRELQAIDHEENHHYLSTTQYKLLSQLARKRNYYSHESALNFLYIKDSLQSEAFKIEYEKLKTDLDSLSRLQREIENTRITLLIQKNKV